MKEINHFPQFQNSSHHSHSHFPLLSLTSRACAASVAQRQSAVRLLVFLAQWHARTHASESAIRLASSRTAHTHTHKLTPQPRRRSVLSSHISSQKDQMVNSALDKDVIVSSPHRDARKYSSVISGAFNALRAPVFAQGYARITPSQAREGERKENERDEN